MSDEDTMPPFDKDTKKQALKDAIKEFLDEQYAEFGRWSAKGLIAGLFAAIVYLYLKSNGWTH